MKYVQPLGADEGDPYVNPNPGAGIQGSPVPAEALEHPQREIIYVIEQAGLTPDDGDLTQLYQAILALNTEAVGSLKFWPASTPPSGWLERDGSAVSRTVYADLFAIIGTTYGVGDGTTTFNLPDDRGLFERGWDHGRGYDSGRVFGSEQADDLKAHTHLQSSSPTASGTNGMPDAVGRSGVNTTNIATASTGGSETRPKNRAYLPIIKY